MNEPNEPLLRVIALHDLNYCHRLFYLTEVENLQSPNDLIYAGRELHKSLEDEADDPEIAERTQLELEDPALGLMGKVDALRRRDGAWIPYEHKRGKARRDNGVAGPWPSDRLQVIAYAALIESATGKPITEGRVRYHGDNVAVRVPIDTKARADLADAIATARLLRLSLDRPPVTDNERLCVKCSLAPVCLPEEVRQDHDPGYKATRLYPPERDGATLHVLTQGATVGRSGESFTVKPPDETPASRHPSRAIDSLLIHGFAQISTQAIALCSEEEIPVHWLTTAGRHVASLTHSAGQVQRRIRQYKALADDTICFRLAKALTQAKVESQVRYLLRVSRGSDDARLTIESAIRDIRAALTGMERAETIDSLRGHEGQAASGYLPALGKMLIPTIHPDLTYATRRRRPPKDRFNALLSYGYGLLHTAVMRAVLAAGLEPALGFFHTPRSAAYPLVLDLMELFRVPVWDMVLVASLNRNQWHVTDDFEVTPGKVWLSDSGRKKAIGLFEARLNEQWKHPVVNYSLSYARTIELEARLLEKEWTGEPGLFARMRLR
jgi:CRISPR-associated protein Cas1